MTIPLECVPRLRRGVGFRRVGGEGVLLVAETSEAIVVNGTGTRILELIDGTRSVGDIQAILAAEFEISPERLEVEVRSFLEKGCTSRILEVPVQPG